MPSHRYQFPDTFKKEMNCSGNTLFSIASRNATQMVKSLFKSKTVYQFYGGTMVFFKVTNVRAAQTRYAKFDY